MPELAEVEYYRRRWNPGLGQRVLAIRLREGKRLLRGVDVRAVRKSLPGSTLVASGARGKQMVFRFSNGAWLGLHLGMTGQLSVARQDFAPSGHDHLVLYQQRQALVFRDPRQFGRVRFHPGPDTPGWWADLPEPLSSPSFTVATLRQFLQRHRRAPMKAVLLLQDGFPGIGNWMADEILWRAHLHPRVPAGRVGDGASAVLWRVVRQVCRGAMQHVSGNFGDPPKGWLFNERWSGDGHCPRDGKALRRATIGGRTTAWCPGCQPWT